MLPGRAADLSPDRPANSDRRQGHRRDRAAKSDFMAMDISPAIFRRTAPQWENGDAACDLLKGEVKASVVFKAGGSGEGWTALAVQPRPGVPSY